MDKKCDEYWNDAVKRMRALIAEDSSVGAFESSVTAYAMRTGRNIERIADALELIAQKPPIVVHQEVPRPWPDITSRIMGDKAGG